MTDNFTQHPTNDELSAFATGDLSPDDSLRIEQHVSECDPCCETIVGFGSDDTFMDLLREAGSGVEAVRDPDGAGSSTVGDAIPAPLLSHSRYEIEQLCGRGGMGRVYKARHRMMDRTVALKVIHREWVRNKEAIDRFQREVKTAASLDHKNIVTAHDAEQVDDLHVLVMEFVDGADLAQVVKERGPLPVDEACGYIAQAAEGLQYAHERGMVHRDIKPHNLIVTKDNVVKILDFGLASLSPQLTAEEPTSEDTDGNLTIAGAIMGTPDFISPEQAVDARAVDGRSDIYSLGMTLYYLLAGRVPFGEGSANDKLRQHAEAEPAELSELRDDIPREVQDIVARMIAKDPGQRFQTPQEVAAAIREFADARRDSAPAEALPVKRPRFRGAMKVLGGCAVLLMVVAAAFQLSNLFGSRDKDGVYAPLSELESYVQSMVLSPHDLVFLNLGQIGPDRNYICFKPIDGGVHVRLPAFGGGPFGQNRQGKFVERFKQAAAAKSIEVTEKSEIDKTGAIKGVNYSIAVKGDPKTVASTVVKIVTRTFSARRTDSCRFNYQNLPAASTGKIGAGPKRVSAEEFVLAEAGRKRVYFGEVNRWIYLVPPDRRNEKKLQRNADVWYTNINELPAGFASRIRQEIRQPSPVPGNQPELKMVTNGSKGIQTSPGRGRGLFGASPGPISRARLRDMSLWFIRNKDVRWKFANSSVVISNNGALLPYDFRKELARGKNVREITGSWQLLGGERIRLFDLKFDGAKSTHEVTLPIGSAGPIRVNIGKHQYNIGTPQGDRGNSVATDNSDNPRKFDLSQVPGNATQIIGYRPQQILQDRRFASLRNQRLPLGGMWSLFANENVAEFLNITMPREETEFSVHVVTVATGSAMEVVDRALGIKDRNSMSSDASPYYATHHVTDGPIYARRVNRKTVVIGKRKDLVAHRSALEKSANESLVQLADPMRDAVLFIFADTMTADEAQRLRHIAEEFDFPSVRGLNEIWMNSSYIGASVSLGNTPKLQILSRAEDEKSKKIIANETKDLKKTAQAFLQISVASHMLGLNPETGDALADAIAKADVVGSGLDTRLTIPLGHAEKPLLKMMNDMFDAEQKRKQTSKFNLKSIALAFHQFHDVHGYFPSVSTRLPNVDRPVSWRVAILPFIQQGELYEQYNLDEPWDSDHNQKLLKKMPGVYRHPNAWQRGPNANYVVFVGQTATGTTEQTVEFKDVTDGLSLTLMIAEAATTIPWTKPEDIPFDPAKELPPIGDLSRDGWHAALGDGSVKFIPSTTSADAIKALITRAGGERIKQEGETFVLPRPAATPTTNATVGSAFTDAVARKLLPEAASMPIKDFENIARSQVAVDPTKLTNQSLTMFLLSLDATDKEAAKDLRFVPDRIRPSSLAEAITISRFKGYASLIQPKYITACKVVTNAKDKNEASGWVEFKAPKLYEGKVNFKARWAKDAWKIVEFTLPNAKVILTVGENGMWSKSKMDENK